MKIEWSPLALERVEEVVDFIARERPQAAARWLERLLAAVERLGQYPRRGRIVPEIGRDEIREIVHRPCRVIYRVEPRAVRIVTVHHGRRRFNADELRNLP